MITFDNSLPTGNRFTYFRFNYLYFFMKYGTVISLFTRHLLCIETCFFLLNILFANFSDPVLKMFNKFYYIFFTLIHKLNSSTHFLFSISSLVSNFNWIHNTFVFQSTSQNSTSLLSAATILAATAPTNEQQRKHQTKREKAPPGNTSKPRSQTANQDTNDHRLLWASEMASDASPGGNWQKKSLLFFLVSILSKHFLLRALNVCASLNYIYSMSWEKRLARSLSRVLSGKAEKIFSISCGSRLFVVFIFQEV